MHCPSAAPPDTAHQYPPPRHVDAIFPVARSTVRSFMLARGPHHEPVAVIPHMEQRYGFEQGIAWGRTGLPAMAAPQRVADKRLLHQVSDDDASHPVRSLGGP